MAGKYDRYIAKAISGEFGKSQKKGTDFVGVVFEVSHGDAKGTKFGWDGYFTDSTSERTVQSLRLAGCTFPGDDITNLSGLGSKEVEIQVEQTDFGPRVAWVNEPRVSAINDENKLDAGGKKALAGKLKGLLLATKGGGLRAQAQKSSALDADPFAEAPANSNNQQATGTDNIPF